MKKLYIFLFIFLLNFIFISDVNAWSMCAQKIDGTSISIEVETSDTIEAVKEKIYNLDNNINPMDYNLIFDGKTLEVGRTLADYQIPVGSTSCLVLETIKYKVVFDANGGTFNNDSTWTIDKWENGMESSLKIPTRDGYEFLGYYTEKTNGTKFELILAESGIDNDMTFYALWKEKNNNINNPQTNDNIMMSIVMMLLSLIGIVILSKNKYINNL